MFIVGFIFTFFEPYNDHKEITTSFTNVTRTRDDIDEPVDKLRIFIHTNDGTFIVENVLSTSFLFSQIENEFESGDPISITYFSGSSVIGIKSETRMLLNESTSKEKLDTDKQLKFWSYPLFAIVDIIEIVYCVITYQDAY